jgi:[ribosomal protein S18]-alanine N-acetyltransferase
MNEVVSIESMQLNQVPAVSCIEQQIQPSPWREQQFAESLKAKHDCRVLLNNGRVIGYVITRIVGDEAELLNIGIALCEQRKGYAKQLLTQVEHTLKSREINVLFLEVRESNLAARALYQHSGFHEMGERPDYYPGKKQREKAITMKKKMRTNHQFINEEKRCQQ